MDGHGLPVQWAVVLEPPKDVHCVYCGEMAKRVGKFVTRPGLPISQYRCLSCNRRFQIRSKRSFNHYPTHRQRVTGENPPGIQGRSVHTGTRGVSSARNLGFEYVAETRFIVNTTDSTGSSSSALVEEIEI